ncbi:hypothetical protein Trydic_g9038 [Trypoxylus dichotomus]
MDQALEDINADTINLSAEDVKRNNEILHPLLDVLLDEMILRDELFGSCFQEVFYGGSYYDGSKIRNPDEFDLDLLLCFPKCKILRGEVPGHVKIRINHPNTVDSESTMMRNLLADNRGYLLTWKFNAWFKNVVHKAFRPFKLSSDSKEYQMRIDGYKLKISVQDHGPAKTLVIRVRNFTINVDLVPCILFSDEDWPAFFTKNPVRSKVDTFFAVPMSPKIQVKPIRRCNGQPSRNNNYGRCINRIRNEKNEEKQTFYRSWRLSFQEQERHILKNKRSLKPCLRLLKLLRDALHHNQIASYYLKNFMLNLNKKYGANFWNGSLSEVFMDVLEEYVRMLKSGMLTYYWDKQYNILENIDSKTLSKITRSIERVFNSLNHTDDPEVVFDCFRTDEAV